MQTKYGRRRSGERARIQGVTVPERSLNRDIVAPTVPGNILYGFPPDLRSVNNKRFFGY